MRKALILFITISAATACLPRPAASQIAGAGIHGVVRNQVREPVAGAKITSINRGTNQTHTAVTDEEGRYRLPSLDVPGAIINKGGQLFFNPALPLDPVRKIPLALMPGTGQFGTMGRNAFIGAGYKNMDFSVIKDTTLRERLRVQFRFETFNVFNTTNLALPTRLLSNPFFGLSNKTQDVAGGLPGMGGGGPRVVQLAFKLFY